MWQLADAAESIGFKDTNIYALKNIAEFTAEFFSKPALREAMKHIPYVERDADGNIVKTEKSTDKKPKSIFQKFLEIIKKALFRKKPKEAKAISLFDKASELLDRIMSESIAYEGEKADTTFAMEDSSLVTLDTKTISNKTEAFGVQVSNGSQDFWGKIRNGWQKDNPQGIVAYRKHGDSPKTFSAEAVNEGWIGNPFSTDTRGATTVQQFYEWIVTGNNFGNTRATEEFRQAIIGKILSTPEGAPILYYTELNRPSHATVIGYLVNNKELLRNNLITIVRNNQTQTQTNQEMQTKPQEKTKEIKDEKLEQVYTINDQYNRILNSKVLTSTDLAEVSDIIADMISSKIDEMETNRDQVKELLLKRTPADNTDVNNLSRFDLIKKVGIQHFIELVMKDFVKIKRMAEDENIPKITEVLKNWDYFISRIKSTISKMEGIHLSVDASGQKEVAKDKTPVDSYEEDGSNIQDQVEDGLLSWQIENNTIDPIESMTELVKARLRGLYVLKVTGKDSDGNPVYEHVPTKWGADAKVGYERAAKCLLRWLHNKASIKEMLEMLNTKAKRNPWVTQLIPMLSDTSGKYTTEQSQFFSTFYKPFMKFTNVGTKEGKLVSRQLNEHPFLTMAMKTIEASYKLNQSPIISEGLAKGAKALEKRYTNLKKLMGDFDANAEAIYMELRAISKGLGFEVNVAELQLDADEVNELLYQLDIITTVLIRNANNSAYDPFAYGKDKQGIRSNLMRFFGKITDIYEDEAVTSFYEGGKMRQSYLLPSFLSMFTNKFHLEGEAFNRFIASEFNSEFFRTSLLDSEAPAKDLEAAVRSGWNNVWLQEMVSDPKKRKNFSCKTSLTFNGSTYMRGMSGEEYTLAMITEFFGENSKESDPQFLANFRIPIESNKPSAEYITFYARGGAFYKDDLVTDFVKVFNQELCRIKTVKQREKQRQKALAWLRYRHKNGELTKQQYNSLVYSINEKAITHFDGERGKKFLYLDFLNDEVKHNTELGRLIKRATQGKSVDSSLLSQLVSDAIRESVQSRVDRMINDFKKKGVFEQCLKIERMGGSYATVQSNLELMLWNDAFASTQIMQLLITDPAFLKDTDDVQKRFAQVHASGNRANINATDFNGVQVSDGIHRSITFKDVKGFVSNVIENLTTVLDRKIEKYEKGSTDRIAWETLKERLVGEDGLYRKETNLTDAQAYSCPTSYRKKALMFGLWSKEDEATYLRIKDGDYTYSDVVSVFQPFKPFVYGNGIEDTGVSAEGTMSKMRVSVQNKNAECLLVLADAIIGDEDTGRPNLLKVLFKVMEDSHYDSEGNYKRDGIDTVNFESAVKSGAQGRIDTKAFEGGETLGITAKDGSKKEVTINHETAFRMQLESLIYSTNEVDGTPVTTYNRTTVKHLSYENYCMQQSVPEHFLDHSQLEGSQQRALIPSDLASVDDNDNPIMYKVGDKEMTAQELRERYDELHSQNIQKGIDEINELFNLSNSTPQQRKEALSKLLVDQFLDDGRYSGDMLYMVTLNRETGEFPVSLEDPSIKTQVEQAINSIIKSRVNKLKMAGGPLVQMSNFGMSKELRIKFRDKDGNLLMTREEYEKNPIKREISQSDKFNAKYKKDAKVSETLSYKEYIEKYQAGIDHYEVIAPAYTETIFKEFVDSNGNISVDALEALNPDLLKMIGYRIPTEAKYSIAPLKIVGFAPREMGDVIILPAEITLINGSDFDKHQC